MPDMAKVLEELKTKLKSKKAKVKALKDEPTGTKSKKLDSKLAKAFKDEFNVDFSKVSVHTGGNAPDLCKQLAPNR